MKIAVLDYSSGCVDIFEVPKGENIGWYLNEDKGYNSDNIEWMEVKAININIGESLSRAAFGAVETAPHVPLKTKAAGA